jgi:hypothetical protein
MNWLTFVAGAVLSWGVYGAMLHQGQTKLGSPMRALLCVGIAYFLIGVLVPVITMMSQGQLDSRGWNSSGATFATVAGGLGAVGAACIIFSFRSSSVAPLSSTCCTQWPSIRQKRHRIRFCMWAFL